MTKISPILTHSISQTFKMKPIFSLRYGVHTFNGVTNVFILLFTITDHRAIKRDKLK